MTAWKLPTRMFDASGVYKDQCSFGGSGMEQGVGWAAE
jgi:hypothetical protein